MREYKYNTDDVKEVENKKFSREKISQTIKQRIKKYNTRSCRNYQLRSNIEFTQRNRNVMIKISKRFDKFCLAVYK